MTNRHLRLERLEDRTCPCKFWGTELGTWASESSTSVELSGQGTAGITTAFDSSVQLLGSVSVSGELLRGKGELRLHNSEGGITMGLTQSASGVWAYTVMTSSGVFASYHPHGTVSIVLAPDHTFSVVFQG